MSPNWSPSPAQCAWETQILAYHDTSGASNGPTEAVNLLIEKTRRIGHGFRSFTNYRLRLLLACGVTWETPPSHEYDDNNHAPPRRAGNQPPQLPRTVTVRRETAAG
jgi:hypothetical protein